jgi:hypothetical protein
MGRLTALFLATRALQLVCHGWRYALCAEAFALDKLARAALALPLAILHQYTPTR